MPTTTSHVKLGHNCPFKIDGVTMHGTRDAELTVTSRTVDVTAWNHQWCSTLPTAIEVSLNVTFYWGDEVNATLFPKLTENPKQPIHCEIGGVASGYFAVSDIKINNPLNNVVAYDVTFVPWSF